jgi:hypothetical protein
MYTLHVFNVLSTFKHYFTQNMMFSSVKTYNFYSNVKEIKKISVNLLFRQRVMASMIFTHRDNPKLLLDHVLTIFRLFTQIFPNTASNYIISIILRCFMNN